MKSTKFKQTWIKSSDCFTGGTVSKAGSSLLSAGLLGLALSACSINRDIIRTTGTVPDENLEGQLYGALNYDFRIDAMIGNGGWGPTLQQAEATIHFHDLRCKLVGNRQFCTFDIRIEAETRHVEYYGDVPEALRCTVRFRPDGDGWTVEHLRPKHGRGHSRTTVKCNPLESA